MSDIVGSVEPFARAACIFIEELPWLTMFWNITRTSSLQREIDLEKKNRRRDRNRTSLNISDYLYVSYSNILPQSKPMVSLGLNCT